MWKGGDVGVVVCVVDEVGGFLVQYSGCYRGVQDLLLGFQGIWRVFMLFVNQIWCIVLMYFVCSMYGCIIY